MGRFGNSVQIVKESWAVLKQDKEIMLFPILSGIATLLLFISFAIPYYYYIIIPKVQDEYLNYGIMFLFYLLMYFIVIFFNSALVTCANMRLNGQDPTFGDGIKNAFKHIGRIFVWALISATVGMILRVISERSQLLMRIVIAIVGMIWSLLTFFVVPVMIVENLPVGQAIKKSAELFKRTWGENVIGQVAISLFFFLLFFLGFIPIIFGLFVAPPYGILIGLAMMVLYWIILILVSTALNGIFVVALYNFANTGRVPKAFSPNLIQGAFSRK